MTVKAGRAGHAGRPDRARERAPCSGCCSGLYPPESGSITIGGVDVSEYYRPASGARASAAWSSISPACRAPCSTRSRWAMPAYHGGNGEKRRPARRDRRCYLHRCRRATIRCAPTACSRRASGSFSPSPAPRRQTPAVLLLDEITANLDAETEARVLEALRRASEGRTVLSVSHRVYENLGGRTIEIRPQPV